MKSWIKKEVYKLPGNTPDTDTTYLRYSFQKNKVDISFSPGWNDYRQDWDLNGNILTITGTFYKIEELTDSTLTIASPGFRRVILVEENYLGEKPANLRQIGEYNNIPLYEANKFITPRYKKEGFVDKIRQDLDGYNIKKAVTFVASFVVTTKGEVVDPQIVHGISEGFDATVLKNIKKTSGSWAPAVYHGQHIQTRMLYTIKYLDSNVR